MSSHCAACKSKASCTINGCKIFGKIRKSLSSTGK